ncbi:MAG: SIMPL domain-containing protein [Chloroflexota bacterium]
MEHGVLKVKESAEMEIEASRAFVMVQVSSNKVAFGNAALSASEDLKSAINKIKKVDDSVEIDTDSVSTTSSSSLFGKNSSANYTIKITVAQLDKLGQILGVCSDGKNISVNSVRWDYDEDEPKLELIKQAMKKAKHKAVEMMSVIDYEVVGIRSCSDSYQLPHVNDIILHGDLGMPQPRMKAVAASSNIDIGAEFKSKKKISAMCNVEFLVKEKS